MSAIGGLSTHFTGREKYKVGGKRYTPRELAAVYQAHLDAIHEVTVALAAYTAAVRKERSLGRRARSLTLLLKTTVSVEFGPDPGAWAAFGWALPKKPGPKTVAAKLQGVRKREAARAARSR
jgi:hypothetical protein